MSGTPAPNNPSELWPLLYTYGVTKLKYEAFVTQFCTYYDGPHGRQITGAKQSAIPELRELLKPIILRRRKEEVMTELPPIRFSDVVVEPGEIDLGAESSFVQYVSPVDRRQELEEKLKTESQIMTLALNNIPDRNLAEGKGVEELKMLAAMSNSVATLRRYTGLQKVQGAVELIAEELKSKAYEKVVIFAIHRDVIEGLRVKLRRFNPVTLYGGLDPAKRQRNIDRFMNDPKVQIFIGNIQAAGTAITLTSAHNVVFVEQDWVPGNNAQAAMRCHRIGQTKPVFVRFLGLANSIDEKIAQVLKKKTRDLTAIFDDRNVESIFI